MTARYCNIGFKLTIYHLVGFSSDEMNRGEQVFKNELITLLPRLRRFSLSLTGSVDASDDLVQAACERALSRFHQWRPGSSMDRWVFSILHSIWMNELRASRVRCADNCLDVECLPDQKSDQAETSLRLGALERSIFKLPEAQRVVVSLVSVEGYSYKEAAEILNIPIGTIMSRLARARLALVESLDEIDVYRDEGSGQEIQHAQKND